MKVREGYKLSETACLELGGHCYELQDRVIASAPVQYVRVCKHCGHTQLGIEQPHVDWHDSF